MELKTIPIKAKQQTANPCIDLFYLYVAGYINAVPTLRAFMDELYETNKVDFYEKAKNSPYYDATFMTDSPLDREVSMKRAFGVLLFSEQDELLQDKICKAIIKHNKAYAVFTKSFSMEQLADFIRSYERSVRASNQTPGEIMAPIYLVGYLVYCKHGLAKKDKQTVRFLYEFIVKDIAQRESYDQNHFIKFVNTFSVDKYYSESRELKDYKAAAKNNHALSALLDYMDLANKGESLRCAAAQKLDSIFSKCSDEERESSIFISLLATRLFSLYGSSITITAQDTCFSAEELEQIYKITAMSSLVRKSDISGAIRISDFTDALWLAMIIKALKQEREFYFKNNSETQFFELRSLERNLLQLQEEIEIYRRAVADAQNQVTAHKEQITLLNAELAKENKDASKPLLVEIALLRAQIADMQARLDAEAEKTNELYRLREFVFDMQQGTDISVEEVSLDNLIAGKKIYIFGGHINWRNKLKQKYPKLEVLDGHNVSFDEMKLIGADMVLLNTSNMAHALYYKVIDVLRKHGVPFDYLGKYSNPDLLEKEIAEVLLRLKN